MHAAVKANIVTSKSRFEDRKLRHIEALTLTEGIRNVVLFTVVYSRLQLTLCTARPPMVNPVTTSEKAFHCPCGEGFEEIKLLLSTTFPLQYRIVLAEDLLS